MMSEDVFVWDGGVCSPKQKASSPKRDLGNQQSETISNLKGTVVGCEEDVP